MKNRLTGRQVTTMVVAVCVAAVLTPVGVNAATGALSNIVDPVYAARKARVSNLGALVVVEADPFTNTRAKVSTDGKRLVGDGSGALTVDGRISAAPAKPARPWNNVNGTTLTGSQQRQTLYSATEGPNTFALSSMSLAGTGGAGSVKVHLYVYIQNAGSTGNCENLTGFSVAERFVVVVPTGNTVPLTWPAPLVYSAYATKGRLYCVSMEAYSGPAGWAVDIGATGFLG